MNKFVSLYDKNDEYRFLPLVFRDFHKQKDLFKKIYGNTYCNEDFKIKEELKINWVQLHINTIDVFLFFLAREGFVLKKLSKKKDIFPKNLNEEDFFKILDKTFETTNYYEIKNKENSFKFYEITEEQFKYNVIEIFLKEMSKDNYYLINTQRFVL